MDPRFSYPASESGTSNSVAISLHADSEDDSPADSATHSKKILGAKKYSTLKYDEKEQPVAPQRPLLATRTEPDGSPFVSMFKRFLCCFTKQPYQIEDDKHKTQHSASRSEGDVTQSIITQVQRPTKQPTAGYHNNGSTGGNVSSSVPDSPITSVSRTPSTQPASTTSTTVANTNGAYATRTNNSYNNRMRQRSANSSFDKSFGFLGPQPAHKQGKKTLVLDLDETLVHSSFKPVPIADFIVDIEIDGETHKVYVCKRPGVDEFLRDVGQYYEVIVFTASLSKYADPVMDILDPHRVVTARLFREHCSYWNGNFIKDLAKLGRELSQTLIIDNSPISYLKHPANAMAVTSWFDQLDDTELDQILPWLRRLATDPDVYQTLEFFQKLCTNGVIAPVETMDSILAAAAAAEDADAAATDVLADVDIDSASGAASITVAVPQQSSAVLLS